MKLFRERLKFLGAATLFIVLISLLASTVALLLAGLLWLLSKIHENLPGIILLGCIAGYLIYKGVLLVKWLFVEPIRQARNNK